MVSVGAESCPSYASNIRIRRTPKISVLSLIHISSSVFTRSVRILQQGISRPDYDFVNFDLKRLTAVRRVPKMRPGGFESAKAALVDLI